MSRHTSSVLHRAAIGAFLLGSAAFAAACSSAGGAGGGGNPDLITREQIEELTDENALQVVQRLRPRWLRPRSQASLGTPSRRDPVAGVGTQAPLPPMPEIFVDNVRRGPVESLSQISINEIEQMQFIDATDATTRYGTGYISGIIHVLTR
jgi:hypothetical protein